MSNFDIGAGIIVDGVIGTAGLQSLASFTIFPSQVDRNRSMTIHFAGTNTAWDGTTTLSFTGTGITVNTLVVEDATTAYANITVSIDATLGYRTASMLTGGMEELLANGIIVVPAITGQSGGGLPPSKKKKRVANIEEDYEFDLPAVTPERRLALARKRYSL